VTTLFAGDTVTRTMTELDRMNLLLVSVSPALACACSVSTADGLQVV
jgi:hypothetical protein